MPLVGAELFATAPVRPDDSPVSALAPIASPSPPVVAADPGSRIAANLATALARPLFAPDRRPPADTPSAFKAETIATPKLAGTIIGGDGQRSAIVLLSSSDRPLTLHEGERVGRFTIVSIAPGRIEALGPAGPIVVRIAFNHAEPTPPTPPQPTEAPINPRNRLATEQDE